MKKEDIEKFRAQGREIRRELLTNKPVHNPNPYAVGTPEHRYWNEGFMGTRTKKGQKS